MYLPANSSTVELARSIVSDVTKIYLSPSYDLTLALTSYLVSALGGYTATQLMTQVATTKKVWGRVGWVALAGLVFGGCSIWCLHFIAMLSLSFTPRIPITYAPFHTILSAIVSICATWTAFGYEFGLYAWKCYTKGKKRESRAGRKHRQGRRRRVDKREERRLGEHEPMLANGADEEESNHLNLGEEEERTATPVVNITLDPTADLNEDEDADDVDDDSPPVENDNLKTTTEGGYLQAKADDHNLLSPSVRPDSNWSGLGGLSRSPSNRVMVEDSISPRSSPSLNGPSFSPFKPSYPPSPQQSPSPSNGSPNSLSLNISNQPGIQRRSWTGINPSEEDLRRSSSPMTNGGQSPVSENFERIPLTDPSRTGSLSLTTYSNESSESLPSLPSFSWPRGGTGGRGSISSNSDSLGNSIANDPTISDAAIQAYAGGAISLRMRRLNGSRSSRPFLVEIYHDLLNGVNRKVLIKGTMLGTSAFCMHYEGMMSMRLGTDVEGLVTGGIEWGWGWVVLSWIIASAASIVAVVFMPLSKMDFRRQIAFAIISSAAIAAMHWTGMLAATMYVIPVLHPSGDQDPFDLDSLPPTSTPHGLAITVILVGFATCMISYVLLAHTVTQSRDELVSAIHTKRTLWRVMAEREAAVRADKQKTEFIAVASHEIRTPLHVISGYADLLDRTTLTSEQTECVKFILAGCESIRLITTDVLDFSKLQEPNAQSKARSEAINIRELAQGIAKGCSTPHFRRASADAMMNMGGAMPNSEQSQAGGSPKVEVLLDVCDNIPEIVWGDKVYLTRVVMNLINNALKFTSEGYVLVKIRTEEPKPPLTRPKVAISVRDTGIGIRQELRAAVFAPFRQADTSHTRSHAGTGLGLAICHQLAQRMKGKLGIWSSQGPDDRGTEISLLLPFEGGMNGEAAVLGPSDVGMCTDAPLLFDTPFTTKPDQHLFRHERGIKVGLALYQPLLENYLVRAFEEEGFSVSTISDETQFNSVIDVDRLWMDISTFKQVVQAGGHAHFRAGMTLYFLCDNVFATVEESEFDDCLSKIKADVVCMPRPVIVPDVIEVLADPASADRLNGNRILASSRKINNTAKLELGNLAALNIVKADSSALGLKSPPLVSKTHTQSLVAMMNRETSAAQSARAIEAAVATVSGSVILLVDDNVVNQKLGARLIAKMKHPVETAGNGQIAVDMILKDRSRYGLVLMDCQMPIMDGFEATEKVRKAEKEGIIKGRLPIIALTANVSDDCRKSCMEAGADHFLEKPLDLTKLKEHTVKYL